MTEILFLIMTAAVTRKKTTQERPVMIKSSHETATVEESASRCKAGS